MLKAGVHARLRGAGRGIRGGPGGGVTCCHRSRGFRDVSSRVTWGGGLLSGRDAAPELRTLPCLASHTPSTFSASVRPGLPSCPVPVAGPCPLPGGAQTHSLSFRGFGAAEALPGARRGSESTCPHGVWPGGPPPWGRREGGFWCPDVGSAPLGAGHPQVLAHAGGCERGGDLWAAASQRTLCPQRGCGGGCEARERLSGVHASSLASGRCCCLGHGGHPHRLPACRGHREDDQVR